MLRLAIWRALRPGKAGAFSRALTQARAGHSLSEGHSCCPPSTHSLPPSTTMHYSLSGFKEGAAAGFRWGAIKATIKTLEIFCGQVSGTSTTTAEVRCGPPSV